MLKALIFFFATFRLVFMEVVTSERHDIFRPGESSKNHSCSYVRHVPDELRSSDIMHPDGLDIFYQKYTEAYGIPVIASAEVPDNALKRACYVVRFLFADNYAVRNSYYKRSGRVAVMGINEKLTDIPETRWLPKSSNRYAGLGAIDGSPVCVSGEANILCHCNDIDFPNDVFVHEVAHGVHLLGAKFGINGWNNRLRKQYNVAKITGLWKDTYAMQSTEEYFAEGVMSFFNVKNHLEEPDGMDGPISTRNRLKEYDPVLYQLIREIFPCNNVYLKSCESDRDSESMQELKMDCKISDEDNIDSSITITELIKIGGLRGKYKCIGECADKDPDCTEWANSGECTKNPVYMFHKCRRSCDGC